MQSKHIRVQDEYRTNPLSTQPGGDEVTIYTRDGMIRTYDKIKSPQRYIAGLGFKDDIIRIEIDGELTWTSEESGIKYWER